MSGVQVRVRVGAEQYALPIAYVLEIAEFGDVPLVPGAPPEILGLRNLRGQIVPVIDLGRLLGIERDVPTRVAIVEDGPRRAALAIGEVLDVAELPAADEPVQSDLLTGAVLVDGELVGAVDVPALLARVEAGESA